MTNVESKLTTLLHQHGYKVTNTRLSVFLALFHKEPQSMKQLLASTRDSMDRVSVYRTIELFEKLGVVNRIQIGWKYKFELSDIFSDHHHHMTCLSCEKIIAIDDEQHLEEYMANTAEKHGFIISGHIFEVQGYCKDCS